MGQCKTYEKFNWFIWTIVLWFSWNIIKPYTTILCRIIWKLNICLKFEIITLSIDIQYFLNFFITLNLCLEDQKEWKAVIVCQLNFCLLNLRTWKKNVSFLIHLFLLLLIRLWIYYACVIWMLERAWHLIRYTCIHTLIQYLKKDTQGYGHSRESSFID